MIRQDKMKMCDILDLIAIMEFQRGKFHLKYLLSLTDGICIKSFREGLPNKRPGKWLQQLIQKHLLKIWKKQTVEQTQTSESSGETVNSCFH